nr:adenylosuccinate lyase [Tanacetum cinerariifolium]
MLLLNFDQELSEYIQEIEFLWRKKLRSFNVQEDPEIQKVLESFHFCYTSEDINSLAHASMLREAVNSAIVPLMDDLMGAMYTMAKANAHVPMLFRIHEKEETMEYGSISQSINEEIM